MIKIISIIKNLSFQRIIYIAIFSIFSGILSLYYIENQKNKNLTQKLEIIELKLNTATQQIQTLKTNINDISEAFEKREKELKNIFDKNTELKKVIENNENPKPLSDYYRQYLERLQ